NAPLDIRMGSERRSRTQSTDLADWKRIERRHWPSVISVRHQLYPFKSVRFSDLEIALQPAGRIRPDPDLEGARLHPVAHVHPMKAELLRRNFEAHGPRFAWLERDPLEALQLLDRPGDAADQVAHIELHDFVACSRPGVLDGRADDQGA